MIVDNFEFVYFLDIVGFGENDGFEVAEPVKCLEKVERIVRMVELSMIDAFSIRNFELVFELKRELERRSEEV